MEHTSEVISLRSITRVSRDQNSRQSCDGDEHTPLSMLTLPEQADENAFLNHPVSSVPSVHAEDTDVKSSDASPSTTIYRSSYILKLTLLYMGSAIFAWTITCFLTFRPITTEHYGFWNDGGGDAITYLLIKPENFHALFIKNEKWYRTARLIQSIVSVLTIPMTSAVCSAAAVIFVQRNRQSPSDVIGLDWSWIWSSLQSSPEGKARGLLVLQ